MELAWKDARDAVSGSCKELTRIIDNLSPGKDFCVLKASYPFGAKIAEKSVLHLPKNHSLTNLDAIKAEKNAIDKLSYSPIPLGIITKNKAEVFFDINRKIFSLENLGKGLNIGISEHFGWNTPHTINAGARSLYMLPKISEALSHKQLRKKFGILESAPKNLYDQWRVFSQIANSDKFSAKWNCEVIFLSKKWNDSIKNDPAWSELSTYINQKGLEHSNYSRKKAALDVVWEVFVRSLSEKELKFDPYVVDTLKHIIYISTGTIPASAPSNGNEENGPLKSIQAVYEDPQGYGLEEYIASIMQPQYFSIKKSTPVYYSLQLPTLLESLPRTKKVTSVIDNVRELSDLFSLFLNSDMTPWENLSTGENTLKDILDNIQVDYFHGDMFAYGDIIKSSLKMPESDMRLKYSPLSNKKKVFASNSSFLRGCVRIATKDYLINQTDKKAK